MYNTVKRDMDWLIKEHAKSAMEAKEKGVQLLKQIEELTAESDKLKSSNNVLDEAILKKTGEIADRAKEIAAEETKPIIEESNKRDAEISQRNEKITKLENEISLLVKDIMKMDKSTKRMEAVLRFNGVNDALDYCRVWKKDVQTLGLTLADKYKRKEINLNVFNLRRIDNNRQIAELNECISMLNKQYN